LYSRPCCYLKIYGIQIIVHLLYLDALVNLLICDFTDRLVLHRISREVSLYVVILNVDDDNDDDTVTGEIRVVVDVHV